MQRYNTGMHAPPRRRWFRFGLRTLFVVMTVVACWLGYEVNWIRQRRDALAGRSVTQLLYSIEATPEKSMSAPGFLWLFGEPGYIMIVVKFPYREEPTLTPVEESEVQRIKKLFPEAILLWPQFEWDPPPFRPAESDIKVSRRPASAAR